MSTQINVTTGPRTLLRRSKDNQQANRLNQTQKEVDDQYVRDVREIEARDEQRQQQLRNGAVPEYSNQQFTSAQRDEGVNFGIGWLYESYEDSFEHSYATTAEKLRIAVGSGDGKEWAYQDLELPIPSLSGFELTSSQGYRRTGQQYVDTISFTSSSNTFTPPNQPTCLGSRSWDVERSSIWSETYTKERKNIYFIAPIGSGDACVVIGSAYIFNYIQKAHQVVARAVEVLSGDIERVFSDPFSGGYRYLQSFLQTYTDPVSGAQSQYRCSYLMPFSNTSGLGVGQSLNQFGPDGLETFAWVYQYGTQDNPQPFARPDNSYAHNAVVRVNYAFYVSPTKCRKLEVPNDLAELLEERFPTPEWRVSTSSPRQASYYRVPWEQVDTRAPGFGAIDATGFWGAINYGTPSVYDAIRNNLDFTIYNSPEPLKSRFNRRSAMAAPDFRSDQYFDGIFKGSAFSFSIQVNSNPLVFYPANNPSDYAQSSLFMYMSSYTYMPPSLRPESAYYEFSDYQAIIEKIPANPEFWISYKPSASEGILRNTQLPFVPTWLPDGNYRPRAAVFRLSPDRQLPPALYRQEQHPLVRPVPVENRHTFIGAPIASAPYSFFSFELLAWSSFGGQFSSELFRLGFRSSDLR